MENKITVDKDECKWMFEYLEMHLWDKQNDIVTDIDFIKIHKNDEFNCILVKRKTNGTSPVIIHYKNRIYKFCEHESDYTDVYAMLHENTLCPRCGKEDFTLQYILDEYKNDDSCYPACPKCPFVKFKFPFEKK